MQSRSRPRFAYRRLRGEGGAAPLVGDPRHVLLLTSGDKVSVEWTGVERRRVTRKTLALRRCNSHALRNAKPFGSWCRHSAKRYSDPIPSASALYRGWKREPARRHTRVRRQAVAGGWSETVAPQTSSSTLPVEVTFLFQKQRVNKNNPFATVKISEYSVPRHGGH
jgi:hypothetical protein